MPLSRVLRTPLTTSATEQQKMIPNLVLALPVTLGCALLALAVWSDMREHRIPNWLVLSLAAAGFIHQLLTNGLAGTLYGLGGLAVGISIFIAFYIGRGMGAGDVKLMGAAGTMLGPVGALLAGACSLVAGFLLVLGARQVSQLGYRYSALQALPAFFVHKNNAVRVPYAPAIAAGCITAMWYLGTFPTLITVAE